MGIERSDVLREGGDSVYQSLETERNYGLTRSLSYPLSKSV
jgi:hypothetical protein